MVYDMIASMQTQLTHLHILAMKAMLGHVERITQRTHNSKLQKGMFLAVSILECLFLPLVGP